MTFRSAIYTGTVMHGRRHPVDHVFRSRVMFWAIDLDEVTALEERLIGFSSEKRNVLSLRAKDHIGDPTRTIKQNLLDWLNEQSIDLTEGRIVMVGHLRQFGFVFNPITVFYCYWPDDRLACIVAEVANTFGERYCYLLDPQGNNGDRRLAFRQAKRLHVSPFFGMDQRYEFAFSEPGERIAIRVDIYEGDERVFRATRRAVATQLPTSPSPGC